MSKWKHKLQIKDLLSNSSDNVENARKAGEIAPIIAHRIDKFVSTVIQQEDYEMDEDYESDIQDVFDSLAFYFESFKVFDGDPDGTVSEFNNLLDDLYDEADRFSVWIS